MPRPKWTLNTIYISERLQERLRPISRCALTTVVAPMGYGKTTAVNWYLAERAKAEDAAIVRISVYSDHLAIFWKSVQDAFEHAGIPLLRGYACPDDAAGASLLADDLCHGLAGRGSVYIFIDDFHLITDGRITEFLCTLVNRLPENVHLIVASRDRFLPGDAVMRLGSRVYPIGAKHLRLNHTELSIYAHRCGTDLTDAQVETLLHASEGWFSAVYLNLRTLSEHGALPDRHSDIYAMFSAAMIEPLLAPAAGVSGRHGPGGRVHRADGALRHRRPGHRPHPDHAHGAERLRHPPAGRRELPLPPHDEGPAPSRRSPRWPEQTAPYVSRPLRRVVRQRTGSICTRWPPTGRARTTTLCCG